MIGTCFLLAPQYPAIAKDGDNSILSLDMLFFVVYSTIIGNITNYLFPKAF